MKDNYRGDGDDVPIVGDNFRRRKDIRRRKRRRSKQQPDTGDSDDEAPPFFYDREYNIDWREQYEIDKIRRRRKRRERKANDAEYGIQPSPWNSLRQWTFSKTGIHIPRINVHFDPITILKIRKSWHNIIPGAIVRLGADFETQHRLGGGIWRLRGCLEDKYIGGRFTLRSKGDKYRGAVLEYTKSWLFAGAGKWFILIHDPYYPPELDLKTFNKISGSLATRFNLCAQYDVHSNRGSARFGFRTENMSSGGTMVSSPNIFGDSNRRQSFTIVPILPLDGPDGHLKLEAKTSIELPEPEITVGMDLGGNEVDSMGSVGMGIGGDVDVEIDELNIICLF